MAAFDWTQFQATVAGVSATLQKKGIAERHLSFGGVGDPPAKRITIPTDARSEFLANRAMGDWAEAMLTQAIRETMPTFRVSQYGNTDRIAAGHPEFKDRYLAGVEETRFTGKRPDLLLFPSGVQMADDISEWSTEDRAKAVNQAIAAIEVRSSKFEALTYMRVRQEQTAAGKKGVRATPSFTVKVEDLIIVYRWMERYQLPQTYCQVFFDSIFAINFLDIFTIISSGVGFTIETPAKSQEKATIMIPITSGSQIATGTALPHFEAEQRVTELGRHDVFVVPKGGHFVLDLEQTLRVLSPLA